jgi:hypothetical protein
MAISEMLMTLNDKAIAVNLRRKKKKKKEKGYIDNKLSTQQYTDN